MKLIKKVIIAALVVALLAFTAVFLINSYNTGKIGDKAGKIADDFTEELLGNWEGEYSISSLTFEDEGKLKLTVLGLDVSGEYDVIYDLETGSHTLNILYNSSIGLSIEREFTVTLENDTLTLIDNQLSSVKMTYTRSTAVIDEEKTTEKDKITEDEPKTDTPSESDSPDLAKLRKDIVGAWSSPTNTNSGYTFDGNYTVKVTLFGVSYDGTYSTKLDEEMGKLELTITYISVAGVNVNNSYYVTFTDDGKMVLAQKGLEALTTTYTRIA